MHLQTDVAHNYNIEGKRNQSNVVSAIVMADRKRRLDSIMMLRLEWVAWRSQLLFVVALGVDVVAGSDAAGCVTAMSHEMTRFQSHQIIIMPPFHILILGYNS